MIRAFVGCKKLGGIKDSTLKAYLCTLKQFLTYRELSLVNVTTNNIRDFLLTYETKASKRTVDNARRNLNSFFQFLEDEGYIEKNPCKRIKEIKTENHIKRFYTDLEMESMRDNCITKREIAIVDFLLSTGVRVSELGNIKLSDVNWNERTVSVIGKGDKERIIPFSARAKKHIDEYLNDREGDSIYLFCQSKVPYAKMSKGALTRTIHNIGDRAGLPDITIHCFRSWYASDLCKKGVDLDVVQYLLGHSSINTTLKCYVKNSLDKVRQIHEIYVN